jgi:nitrogen fixation NifU-like protein
MTGKTEYTENVMKHFLNPKNMGEIKNADSTAQVTNPICSDTMKVYLKIKNNKIIDAKFQTMGCAAAIASSDVACDLAKGKTLKQAETISKDKILKALGGLPSEKKHCSLLGQDALKKAIKNYRKKV